MVVDVTLSDLRRSSLNLSILSTRNAHLILQNAYALGFHGHHVAFLQPGIGCRFDHIACLGIDLSAKLGDAAISDRARAQDVALVEGDVLLAEPGNDAWEAPGRALLRGRVRVVDRVVVGPA